MLIELAHELKNIREQLAISLEAVAGPANITAAYLHKLERGVVNTPSPRVLRRLARVLGLPYLRLMELAGYLGEKEAAEAQQREPSPHPHPLADQQLSPAEWRAVGAFIQTLIAQRSTTQQERQR